MLRRVWQQSHRVLDERDARQFFWLNAAVVVVAGVQAVGIASILPFMELVSNPEAAEHNPWIRWARESLDIESRQQFLIVTGIAALVLLALANGLLLLATWWRHRLVWQLAHRVSLRLARSYMGRDYEFFVRQSSAELIRKSVSDIHTFASGVLLAGSDLIANAMVAIAILVLLLFVQPILTIVSLTLFGGLFCAIYVLGQSYGKRLGQQRLSADSLRHRSFSDLINGVRTIRTDVAEDFFVERFEGASNDFASISTRFQVVTNTPRYLVETLAFGAILGAIVYRLSTGADVATVLPVLTVFALAGYRLLPSLNRVFVAMSTLRHSLPVVDSLAADLPEASESQARPQTDGKTADWQLRESLALHDVSFTYQGAETFALSGINITIRRGSCTALIGTTGSGKSTIADILVRLLEPQSGEIQLDGNPWNGEKSAWRHQIGYVPQSVFLFDGSIEQNIAFGVNSDSMDQDRVRRVAEVAQIDSFITQELQDGYETTVGDRGERLSGGQRQRIGLARALYREPTFLILDEATSALDRMTEADCLEQIRSGFAELTVLFVTHRLSSLRFCDSIYLLEGGRIEAEGTYAGLLESSDRFRSLLRVSESEASAGVGTETK